VGQITRLTQVFVEKGLAGDTQSCLCAVRLFERKHELLGMNAAAKFEVVTRPPEAKSQHERIREVIMAMVEREQPVRRAAIRRLDELGPERVLELLGPPEPKTNGDGTDQGENAVDPLSNSDDPTSRALEPSALIVEVHALTEGKP